MDDLRQKLIMQSLGEFASDLRHCDTMGFAICALGVTLGTALFGSSPYVQGKAYSKIIAISLAFLFVGIIVLLFSFTLALRIKSLLNSIASLEKTIEVDYQVPYAQTVRNYQSFSLGPIQIFYINGVILIVAAALILSAVILLIEAII